MSGMEELFSFPPYQQPVEASRVELTEKASRPQLVVKLLSTPTGTNRG